jgi:UDP-glucose 6-dehydrogenase
MSRVTIARKTLAEQGAVVSAYDPEAAEEATPMLHAKVTLCENVDSALENATCIFIATDWPEFTSFSAAQLVSVKLVVDCMNSIDKTALPKTLRYIGVGRR